MGPLSARIFFFSVNVVVTAGLESEDSPNPGWQTVFLSSQHGFYLQFIESANMKGPTVESKVISGFSSVWGSITVLFKAQL